MCVCTHAMMYVCIIALNDLRATCFISVIEFRIVIKITAYYITYEKCYVNIM